MSSFDITSNQEAYDPVSETFQNPVKASVTCWVPSKAISVDELRADETRMHGWTAFGMTGPSRDHVTIDYLALEDSFIRMSSRYCMHALLRHCTVMC